MRHWIFLLFLKGLVNFTFVPISKRGPSWSWSYGRCEFESRSWQGVPDTTLCDKVLSATGLWFSPSKEVNWFTSSKNVVPTSLITIPQKVQINSCFIMQIYNTPIKSHSQITSHLPEKKSSWEAKLWIIGIKFLKSLVNFTFVPISKRGPSWSWSYGRCELESRSWQGVPDTTL
jgi:hypothetical protein